MKQTFNYSLEGQETERLVFRKLSEEDFDAWLEFCKFPDSLIYVFSHEQLKVEDPIERCRIWFDRVFNRYNNELGGMNALIDKETGALVGQCGLLIQTIDGVEELEIGYSIMPAFRGKGFATEAAIKCKQVAFEQNFAASLISIIVPENSASIGVALNNGMHLDKTTMSNGVRVHVYRINK